MAKQWQIRRGTKAQNDNFTGAEGEVSMDTTNKTLRVHDGSTVGGTTLATSTDLSTLLSSIYAVGSIYIGTQSTCPIAVLIPDSTWEKLSTALVTSVNTSASVKGNGKALGLTSDGSNMYALGGYGTAGLGGYFQTFLDNTTLGSTSGAATRDTGALGVSKDPTKSGMVANVSSNNITVNIWKRTA